MATGNHKVEIVVGVKDLATKALGNVQREITSMSKGINTAGNSFGGFSRGLDGAIGKLDRMATSMYRFNMYTSDLQRNLKGVALVAGAAAGALAINGANKSINYEYSSAKMQSRMESSAATRKEIDDYILKELNQQVAFNPVDLANMGVILGQAGVNNTTDMKAMLKTTSYFAEAVDAVPEQAAEMVISAAKGFNISMENSGMITDKLAVALNKSLLHVEELPHAIGELAGRANMFGQGLDSSLTALSIMRNQGMGAAQGSQDFLHALRQASRIGNDSVMFKRTQGYFDELGVDRGIFNQDTKKLKEYPELIADIEKMMVQGGFTNDKYKVESMADFQKIAAQNGGKMPEDFWNSMKAMPLITKIFGAAGTAPILMGLQSQYEEVDKETGEKTGKVFYGAEAVKRTYEDIQNSEGAVEGVHDIMSNTSKFQIDVLKGAWDAAQIGFMDNFLPAIQGGSELLTGYLSKKAPKGPNVSGPQDVGGKLPGGLEKFEGIYEEIVGNFREKGANSTADIVKGIGDGIVNSIKIGDALGPIKDQVGSAFGDLFQDDWGDSLIELPFHVVKNGLDFIGDIGKANQDFKDAIDKLPKELQAPAELTAQIAKGGLALLATGAIVGVVRMAIMGLSTALKGAGLAKDLTMTVAGWITGKKGKGGVTDVLPDLTTTMNANIVNVYGKVVNGGVGGGVDIDGKGKNKPILDQYGNPMAPSKRPGGPQNIPPVTKMGLGGLLALSTLTVASLVVTGMLTAKFAPVILDKVDKSPITQKVRDIIPGVDPDGKIKKAKAEQEGWKNLHLENATITASGAKVHIPTSTGSILGDWKKFLPAISASKAPEGKMRNLYEDAGINKTISELNKSTSSSIVGINGAIVSGFNAANDKLNNVRVDNALNVSINPNISISGNFGGEPTVKVSGNKATFNKPSAKSSSSERGHSISSKRYGGPQMLN